MITGIRKSTMIIGVGTDVVDIDRFRTLDDRSLFLEQVFTRSEILNAPSGPSQDIFYASLFAVKEALLKSLGCGLEHGMRWREIQINHDWRPQLSGFMSTLARQKSVSKIHVSRAHSKTTAVAFVLIETIKNEETV